MRVLSGVVSARINVVTPRKAPTSNTVSGPAFLGEFGDRADLIGERARPVMIWCSGNLHDDSLNP